MSLPRSEGTDLVAGSRFWRRAGLVLLGCWLGAAASASAQSEGAGPPELPLSVGWARVEITPPGPVALIGQLTKRISTGVRDPLTATVLALETRDESGASVEQAVLVSCDVVGIPRVIQEQLQSRVRAAVPGLEASKLLMNATHTHTAPGFLDEQFKGLYDVSNDAGVMKSSEYASFFMDRVTQAVAQAWESRQPGAMSWAMSHAVVGLNRRAHYLDGTTVMYGETNSPDFSGVEGGEDHAVDLLFFWDAAGKPTGVVINLACPSQETESLLEVSADFWHDVREELHRRHGPGLQVLPQCAPAGDQSPHPIYRKQAEQVMAERRGLSRRQELARRIANAVDDVWAVAEKDMKSRVVFRHEVLAVDLEKDESSELPFYETDPLQGVPIHVIRLDDVAMATNPFELYVDYGARIEARSPAVLTMLVQLSSASIGYLPTERAIEGGGYSADKFLVGPEGGQTLVEATLQQLRAFWP